MSDMLKVNHATATNLRTNTQKLSKLTHPSTSIGRIQIPLRDTPQHRPPQHLLQLGIIPIPRRPHQVLGPGGRRRGWRDTRRW